VNRAFKTAVRLRKLARNPVSDTNLPRRDPAADQRATLAEEDVKAFTEQEVGRILAGLRGSPLHAPVALAAGTGMRRGEVCGLRWGDVDLERGAISVRAAIESRNKGPVRLKAPKTTSSRRTIPIAGKLIPLLDEHRARAAEDGLAFGLQLADSWFVFPTRPDRPEEPTHPRALGQAFARAAAKLGVTDAHFHRLRHYHATVLLERGERVEVVSARLGHADVATTLRTYASVLDAAREKAAATAGAVLDAALEHEPAQPVKLRARRAGG
jgi:integrase